MRMETEGLNNVIARKERLLTGTFITSSSLNTDAAQRSLSARDPPKLSFSSYSPRARLSSNRPKSRSSR